jgi:hypothetical protein
VAARPSKVGTCALTPAAGRALAFMSPRASGGPAGGPCYARISIISNIRLGRSRRPTAEMHTSGATQVPGSDDRDYRRRAKRGLPRRQPPHGQKPAFWTCALSRLVRGERLTRPVSANPSPGEGAGRGDGYAHSAACGQMQQRRRRCCLSIVAEVIRCSALSSPSRASRTRAGALARQPGCPSRA